MDIILLIIIFLLGTIIGSFLNVVIFRFNTGKKITRGRSICMSCNKTLRWFELVPIFSFLIQGGKCRRCASRISWQYIIVELTTGVIFTLIAYHFLPVLFSAPLQYILLIFFFSFIFSLLMVISVYDIKHKIIPDSLVFIFIILSFLSIFINPNILKGVNYLFVNSIFVLPSLITILSGPIISLPFVFLWFISKGRWMGLGDGKLALGIGWFLGLSLGFSAIVLSFWIGAFVGIIILLFYKTAKITGKTEIPFAPFLVIGMLLVFLYNINIFSLISWLGMNLL